MSVDNPRGRQAFEVSVAFTAIAAVVLSLRLYTRYFIIRCLGIEDYIITLSMIFSIGVTICVGFQVHWGMGLHVWQIDPINAPKSLQAFFASILCYNGALTLTKVSILLQYRRVFTTRWFQIACNANLIFAAAFSICAIFTSIFMCVPVRAFWTKEPGAKCVNQFALWFTNASFNIVQDFVLIILPMPVIRSLNLGKRQKGALIGIFAVGGFVCIVSIIRLQTLILISNSQDPTYDNPPAATWSAVETNVGLICSCLTLMRPLATRWLPGVFSSAHKRSLPTGALRPYSTIGTASRVNRGSAWARGTGGYAGDAGDGMGGYVLRETRGGVSPTVVERGGDIQVVTDIRVSVKQEGKGWGDVEEGASCGGTERAGSSTDTLVKEGRGG